MNPVFRILRQAFFISTSLFLLVSLSLPSLSKPPSLHHSLPFFPPFISSSFPSSPLPFSILPFLPSFLLSHFSPFSFSCHMFLISVPFTFSFLIFLFFCYSPSFTHNLFYFFLPENQTFLSLPASNIVVLFYTDLFQMSRALICHSVIYQRAPSSSLATAAIITFISLSRYSLVLVVSAFFGQSHRPYSPISSSPLPLILLLNF